jgi:hypothetical protein
MIVLMDKTKKAKANVILTIVTEAKKVVIVVKLKNNSLEL